MSSCRPETACACAACRAIDAAAECEAWLREAGMHHAATYAHDATATLRLAGRILAERLERDGAATGPDGPWEALVTETGQRTGFALRPDENGVAYRGRLSPDGRFSPTPGTGIPIPAIAHRDLGWELTTSAMAREFAADDLSAALLRRALAGTGWIATHDRQRWSTSWTGASTILRMLRGGRPAPALREGPDDLIDGAVAQLLAGLGWLPEPVRAPTCQVEA
ncbi:hypothetical protein EJC47_11020 [Sphingomonas sp. TF3]|uniref:hypothetical protein n=1 Tax=Sphingomonas sp. TF3 TaxID=2495580 RepID=UPI000F869123|nr:hypothetical protein [Sphingomonas sp. TF3]RUN76495.1 hypothetical protein EJC47_11020 [Sphingomonas sp. TF3]